MTVKRADYTRHFQSCGIYQKLVLKQSLATQLRPMAPSRDV